MEQLIQIKQTPSWQPVKLVLVAAADQGKMSYIILMLNTSSPRQDFVCHYCSETHSLGDRDCDGLPIGWIETDGTPFVSRQERDLVMGSAALREALSFYGRTGGMLGEIEDPYQVMLRARVLPDHFEEVIEEFNSDLPIILTAWRERAAEAVENN